MPADRRVSLLKRGVARYLRGLERPAFELRSKAVGLDSDVLLERRLLEVLAAAAPAGPAVLVGELGWEVDAILEARPARELLRIADAVQESGAGSSEGSPGPGRRDAIAWLEDSGEPIALGVVSAGSERRRQLLDALVRRACVGGFLIFLGELTPLGLDSPKERPPEDGLRRIEQFHHYLRMHPQLRATLLPVGRGVAFAVKRARTIRELGGPY